MLEKKSFRLICLIIGKVGFGTDLFPYRIVFIMNSIVHGVAMQVSLLVPQKR